MHESALGSEFTSRHGAFCRQSLRGYGYWLWKPALLLSLLENPSVRGVFYCDAGSTLNFATDASRRRWCEYIDMAESSGGLFFQMNLPESAWSKSDLTEALGLSAQDCASGQVLGGHFLIRRDSDQHSLLDEWYSWMVKDDYHFVDDSPSFSVDNAEFISHRHDQAVLSGLLKKTGMARVIPDETYFHPNWSESGAGYPIWGTRFRSGASFHDKSTPLMSERLLGLGIRAHRYVRRGA